MESKIVTEMIETLRGLHQSGVVSTSELLESLSSIENRAKEIKSVGTTKSKKLKPQRFISTL
jgi:hypothetical protein